MKIPYGFSWNLAVRFFMKLNYKGFQRPKMGSLYGTSWKTCLRSPKNLSYLECNIPICCPIIMYIIQWSVALAISFAQGWRFLQKIVTVTGQIYNNLHIYVYMGLDTNISLSNFQKIKKYNKNMPKSYR